MNDEFELLPFDQSDPSVRASIEFLQEYFRRRRIGILCFSRNVRTPLLWAHYTDEHQGMCLGFDPAGFVSPMRYVTSV